MTRSPGIWPECETTNGAARDSCKQQCKGQLSGCCLPTRENPSVNIPLKIIENHETRMASGNTGCPGAPSRARPGSHRHRPPLSLGGDSSYHSGRMRCCWVPACTALLGDRGIILPHCRNALFIVRIHTGIRRGMFES